MARSQTRSRVGTRRRRRQAPGKFRLLKAKWVDPYPHIAGTEPEKRIFALLKDTFHVYFIFQGQVSEFEPGGKEYFLRPLEYKPDFVLPEYRLILDPFSPYHHSLPEAQKRDWDKIARYAAIGYAYYHPWAVAPGVWSWDQYHTKVNTSLNSYRRLDRTMPDTRGRMGTLEMLQSIPELRAGPRYPLTSQADIDAKKTLGYRLGPNVGAGANSVGAANRARRGQPVLGLRIRRT